MNAAENPDPLLLPPTLQGESNYIRNCIPAATSMGVEPIHETGEVGLPEISRHVPGSRLRQTITHTFLPGVPLT